jgi:hypothetical protein
MRWVLVCSRGEALSFLQAAQGFADLATHGVGLGEIDPIGHGWGRIGHEPYGCRSPAPGARRLAFLLERLLVSGTSRLWAGTASIRVITTPSARNAVQLGSWIQLTTAWSYPVGKHSNLPQTICSPGACQSAARNMSAKPAAHAPAHAAARSALPSLQPRSRMNWFIYGQPASR